MVEVVVLLMVVVLLVAPFLVVTAGVVRKSQRGLTGTALRVIHEQFGSRDWFVALVAVVFLITFHWFAVETHHLLSATEWGWAKWVVIGAMPAIFLLLVIVARQHQPQFTPEITQHPAAARRALVLLLSPPGQSETELKAIEGSLLDEAVRARFTGPWRMPIEAIAHHARQGVLKTVVVLGSADSGVAEDGTVHWLDIFAKTVNRLAPGVTVQPWRPPEFPAGVDFEHAEKLNACVEGALRWLLTPGKEHSCREREVMLDITGGKKVATVICALQTLFTTQRKFQYVTFDSASKKYEVKEYDVTFRPPEPETHWS